MGCVVCPHIGDESKHLHPTTRWFVNFKNIETPFHNKGIELVQCFSFAKLGFQLKGKNEFSKAFLIPH